jgi:hypothetical protein
VNDAYLWDRSGPPDPDIARLEQLLAGERLSRAVAERGVRPARGRRSRLFVLALCAEAAVVLLLAGVAWFTDAAPVPLGVTRLAGSPSIDARPFDDRRLLGAGAWLETGETGRAGIDIGEIGRVEVDPGSRLGVISTRQGDYRLHLERGTMHALIWAPPGQFVVKTPSSTAVDLGCAYTMTVDGEGVGLVRVISGWVGFEWQGRESFIPAGAVCYTRPGLGPGTPHVEESSATFRAALDTIDLRLGPPPAQADALALVLREAQARDAFTLWHLLTRVEPASRDLVFDRLSALVPAPDGVTRDGIRAGDRAMLDNWWDHLGFGAANWWRVWRQQWRP